MNFVAGLTNLGRIIFNVLRYVLTNAKSVFMVNVSTVLKGSKWITMDHVLSISLQTSEQMAIARLVHMKMILVNVWVALKIV